jgi:hypothetical protein
MVFEKKTYCLSGKDTIFYLIKDVVVCHYRQWFLSKKPFVLWLDVQHVISYGMLLYGRKDNTFLVYNSCLKLFQTMVLQSITCCYFFMKIMVIDIKCLFFVKRDNSFVGFNLQCVFFSHITLLNGTCCLFVFFTTVNIK